MTAAVANPINYNICCSPTKATAGSKLDIITNVKSQMTGWLGSGIPIPGLRKNEAPPAEPTEPAPVETIEEPKAEGKDDDDNSRYIRYEGLADAMSLRSYFFIFFYSHQPFLCLERCSPFPFPLLLSWDITQSRSYTYINLINHLLQRNNYIWFPLHMQLDLCELIIFVTSYGAVIVIKWLNPSATE